jgi:hypothetical protein
MDINNKLEEIVKKYLDNDLGPILAKHFNSAVEDNLAVTKKKPSLAERYNNAGGLLGIGVNYLKKKYTDRKEQKNSPTAIDQAGVGNTLKTTDTAVPTPEPTGLITPEQNKTGEPATASNKGEKHLIRGEGNVVLIGGITSHGVEDLARKLPKALKPVLQDLYKHLGKAASGEKKPNEPTSGGASGGNGLLGSIWNFFKGRGGKKLAVKEAEKLAVKGGAKLATKAVGKVAAKEGVKMAAKAGGKIVAEEGAKAGGKIVAEEGAKAGGKLITEQGAKAGGKLVAEQGAKAGGKILGKEGAKIGGKALGKSVLKKIPGIGLVAGLGFGAERAWHGDWLGAAGEVASGAASLVPGVGTAASIGIDAALAGRDIYKATKGEGEEGATPTVPAETPTDIAAVPPAVQPVEPSVQPAPVAPPPAVTPTTPDHGDIFSDISKNTGKTADLIGSLAQAIMKLAQNTGGNSPGPSIIMSGGQSAPTASAADMMANNSDPIRAIRSKYA